MHMVFHHRVTYEELGVLSAMCVYITELQLDMESANCLHWLFIIDEYIVSAKVPLGYIFVNQSDLCSKFSMKCSYLIHS